MAYVVESVPSGGVVYAPTYYFKRSIKNDEYSYKIVSSKTNDLSELFWPLIKKMIEELKAANRIPTSDLVTIMPSHTPGKFSPTLESIGKKISEEFSIPFEKILERKKTIKKMTECKDADERRENVRGSLATKGKISGKKVLVIDDVLASGSNIAEVSELLKNSGAKSVEFCCLGINQTDPSVGGVR